MRIALAFLATFAVAACAGQTPPGSNSVGLSGAACFRSADIRAHRFADQDTMYLSVRGEGVYRVKMRNGCLAGATSGDPIVMRQPPGASYICKPIDMDIAIAHQLGGYDTPCMVDSIALMTPAEVEALPPRLRP